MYTSRTNDWSQICLVIMIFTKLLITFLYRLVRILMIVMYPVAFPIARLLEHFLGKHERGFYKRSGKFYQKTLY